MYDPYSAFQISKMQIERAQKTALLRAKSVDPKPRARLSLTAILSAVLGVLR